MEFFRSAIHGSPKIVLCIISLQPFSENDTQSHKLIIHDFELLVVTSIILYNHAELNEVLLLNITAKQLEH